MNDDKVEKLKVKVTAALEKQIEWHRKHGSGANRDRLITLAEQHVRELYQHRVKQLAKDDPEDLDEILQLLITVCVDELRAKR